MAASILAEDHIEHPMLKVLDRPGTPNGLGQELRAGSVATEVPPRFPQSRIIGDDWDWPSVQQAVREAASQHSVQVEVHGVGWRIVRA